MKIRVPTTIELNATTIRVELPVRYDEEDIPNDFPLRTGDHWSADVEIDTGKWYHIDPADNWKEKALKGDCITHWMRIPEGPSR